MGKKISKNCLDMIKAFEGLRLISYRDEVGVWTIGYGITSADKSITGTMIKEGLVITKETAEKWLEESLNKKYLPKVLKYDEKYNWNQNEIDALVCFCYNIGSVDQLTNKGNRTRSEIGSKILEYNKAGGVVYSGLVRRRKSERALFLAKEFRGDYPGLLRYPLASKTRGYIQKGDNGNDVKQVQNFLNWLFGCGMSEDGAAGAVTENWIREMQSYFGISADGKWGNDSWMKAMNATVKDALLCHLYYYNQYVKEHGKYFSKKDPAEKTFSAVKKHFEKKESAAINCIAPMVWALTDLGYTPGSFYSKNGSFKNAYKDDIKLLFTRITSGGATGKNIKTAVDKKLLNAGDVIAFDGFTHTFVYSGNGYEFYDGGGAAQNREYQKVGITVDYTKVSNYSKRSISEILRMK